VGRLSALYYALEESGIAVQFASCEGGDKGGAGRAARCLAAERLREGGEDAGDGDHEWLRRFALNTAACEKLKKAVKLDKAVLFKGISFDGICLCGTSARGFAASSQKLHEMIFLLYRLGRVVAAVDGGVEVLARHFTATPAADRHHHASGIKMCDVRDLGGHGGGSHSAEDEDNWCYVRSVENSDQEEQRSEMASQSEEFFDCDESGWGSEGGTPMHSLPPSRRASLGRAENTSAVLFQSGEAAVRDKNVISFVTSAHHDALPEKTERQARKGVESAKAQYALLADAILDQQ